MENHLKIDIISIAKNEFDEITNARRWANNKNMVNIEIAPSLTYIDSGHPNVSLHDFM